MDKQKPKPKQKPPTKPQKSVPAQKTAVKRPPQAAPRPGGSPSRGPVKTPARPAVKPVVKHLPPAKRPYRPPAGTLPTPARPPVQIPVRQTASALQAMNRQKIADSALLEQINAIESRMDSTANEIALENHITAINELDQGILELPEKLRELRGRGYVYKAFLEKKISVIEEKWEGVESQVRADLQRLSDDLFLAYDSLVDRYNRAHLSGSPNSGQINTIDHDLQALRSRLSSADSQLKGLYSNIQQTFHQTQQQLGMIEFLLDALDEAKFALAPNEGPIQAVEAKWWRDGKNDGPEGILFLTDQRLLFEQKETVATKKILFVTTESELLHDLLFEVPIVTVEEVERNDRGIGGFQDHIDLKLGSGASFPLAHFHLKGQTSEEWVVLIKQASTGEVLQDRIQIDTTSVLSETNVDTAASAIAPEKCVSCGAPLPPLSATQRQYECEYCGSVMRW